MAAITLADWTCSLNHCVNPLNDISLTSPMAFTHRPQLPFAWALAHSTLYKTSLSIRSTDLFYLVSGNIFISHLYCQSLRLLPSLTPTVSSHVFSNFKKHNFFLLKHFRSFSPFIPDPAQPEFQFVPHSLHFLNSQYYLTSDFPLLCSWFPLLPRLLHLLSNNDFSLLQSHQDRQEKAENFVLSIIHNFLLCTIPATDNIFATDASLQEKHDRRINNPCYCCQQTCHRSQFVPT